MELHQLRCFVAGIFFWGYCLCEVPSNIVLDKVGARLWIARVMITWGIVSAAMASEPGGNYGVTLD